MNDYGSTAGVGQTGGVYSQHYQGPPPSNVFSPEAMNVMNYQMINGDSRGVLTTALQEGPIGQGLTGFIGEENANKLVGKLTENASDPNFRMDSDTLRNAVGEMLLDGDITYDQASRIVNSPSFQDALDHYEHNFNNNVKPYMLDQGYGIEPMGSQNHGYGGEYGYGGPTQGAGYGGGQGGGQGGGHGCGYEASSSCASGCSY